MKKVLFFIAFACVSATVFAQQAAKAVYFELGGPGLASFNFDTRFSKKEDGFGARIGFGGFSLDQSGAVFVPVGLNYILGKDGRNYFELGAGVTPVIVIDNTSGSSEDDTFGTTFGHLNFGYRLQPADGGFFFRAAINPVFGNGFFMPYYGGVSFGYKFGSRKSY